MRGPGNQLPPGFERTPKPARGTIRQTGANSLGITPHPRSPPIPKANPLLAPILRSPSSLPSCLLPSRPSCLPNTSPSIGIFVFVSEQSHYARPLLSAGRSLTAQMRSGQLGTSGEGAFLSRAANSPDRRNSSISPYGTCGRFVDGGPQWAALDSCRRSAGPLDSLTHLLHKPRLPDSGATALPHCPRILGRQIWCELYSLRRKTCRR